MKNDKYETMLLMWYKNHAHLDEDTARGFAEAFPNLLRVPRPDEPPLATLAKMYFQKDEAMIEKFTELLGRKISRLEKLEAQDMFEMDADMAKRHQNQKDWLSEEINTLSYMARLIIRHQEKWFEPEMIKLLEFAFEQNDKQNGESTIIKDLYANALDSEMFFTEMALKQTERLIDTQQQLTRYQKLFINSEIQA